MALKRRAQRTQALRKSVGLPLLNWGTNGIPPSLGAPVSFKRLLGRSAGTHLSEECALPPAGHGPHEQSERVRKARRSRGLTPIVPQTHHYKVV